MNTAMNSATPDFVVLGAGPGGLKAAEEAAGRGCSVIVVERERQVGGACVTHGTIPSKTLRETAMAMRGFRRRTGDVFTMAAREELRLQSLMLRLQQVIRAHHDYMANRMRRLNVERWHGRGKFLDPHTVLVQSTDGSERRVTAEHVIIATGSRPRTTPEYPVDHSNVLDSDSILSMTYLPKSLAVVGGGVIASEYSSVFASLGVTVHQIDRYPLPLGFLDEELALQYVTALEHEGGTWHGQSKIRSMEWKRPGPVVIELASGAQLCTEKALIAVGRVANVEYLNLEAAGVVLEREIVKVDEFLRTSVPHIYAVGDVAGPPALATSSMDQGRRAVRHALGREVQNRPELIPTGVYSIPELASVGLTEAKAREKHADDLLVGVARFDELARGHIAAVQEGMIKLIADKDGKLLGAHVAGENAAELVHLPQLVLANHGSVEAFVDNLFNFPTLAEGFREAALDILRQRKRRGQPVEVLEPVT